MGLGLRRVVPESQVSVTLLPPENEGNSLSPLYNSSDNNEKCSIMGIHCCDSNGLGFVEL